MKIDIVLKSKKWVGKEKLVEKITKKILPLAKVNACEVSISLVCDRQMKKINLQFRGKDKSTNVLSFSAFDKFFLGDIVLAYETLVREAVEQKKTFNNHLAHLLLHSILHLLGHDHEEEEMAEKMEKLEIKILGQLGISNPY
ncbi:MAG: rRNA maturation RNase YbeY [Alphaproteobacteria bacterium]|nr:rRNA maturation RNase YbeY [Alphaproteobacteria bacterium]